MRVWNNQKAGAMQMKVWNNQNKNKCFTDEYYNRYCSPNVHTMGPVMGGRNQ